MCTGRPNYDQPVTGLQVGSAAAAQLGPESQAGLHCLPVWSNWWAYRALQGYLGNTTVIQQETQLACITYKSTLNV